VKHIYALNMKFVQTFGGAAWNWKVKIRGSQ